MPDNKPSPEVIDKAQHYGRFQAEEDRRAAWDDKRKKLAMRTAHKALDMADDEADPLKIVANKSGIGTLGAVALAGISGLLPLAGILGTWLMMRQPAQSPPATQQQPAQPASPISDREYEVRFYDKDGKLIEVPQLKKKNGGTK